ncbi:hypothetical protein [Flaviaesturariibacter amylovorans]|uniref:Uncharacterized protein n=1 Tax=Flaviaesturariibacter amylovorans TaxID=1084520 RepID=A0ABP8HKZ5_9BACT
MLRSLCSLIAVLTAAGAAAQQEHAYGSFLSTDTTVRWAAEADKVVALLPRVLPQSLNRLYARQLDSGRLRTYRVPGTDLRVREAGPVSRAQLSERASGDALPDFTRAYKDLPPTVRRRFDSTQAYRFYCDTCRGADLELFQLRQLVYLKGGRFYVDNILVSPLEGAPDSSGRAQWAPRFSTSFYKGGAAPRSNPKDRIYLGTVIINYQFAFDGLRGPADDRILTVQEPNPVYQLLEAALKGKVKLRNELNPDTRKPFMNPRTFFADFGATDTMAVYDVNDPGRVREYVVTRSSLGAEKLAVYGIEQSFYYDTRLQVLFSEVHKVTVKAHVYNDNGTIRGRRAMASVTYSPLPSSARGRVEALQQD